MTDATVSPASDAAPASSVLDSVAAKPEIAFANLMPRVTAEFGKTLPSQLKDLLKLSMRSHKLSVDEYYQMALYDDAAYSAEDKLRFVGLQGSRKIWRKVLASNEHVGLFNDKLMFEKTLTAFGFQVPETLAVMGGHYPATTIRRLDDADSVHDFLGSAAMPVFAKPIDSLQSLGSVRIDGYSPSNRVVALSNGETVSLDAFVSEIKDKFGGDYLFQRCVSRHPLFSQMTGGGLSTVRVVTLDSGEGVKGWRAAAKLTSPGTVADNFWRAGNLLSPIDLETGRLGKALTQMGIDGAFVERHPDTDAQIEGVEVPYWAEVLALACNVATLFPGTLMIGFDIAITPEGPVIIEANVDPHLIMMQIAHRKGAMDSEMARTLDYADHINTSGVAEIRARRKAEREQKKSEMKKALSASNR